MNVKQKIQFWSDFFYLPKRKWISLFEKHRFAFTAWGGTLKFTMKEEKWEESRIIVEMKFNIQWAF